MADKRLRDKIVGESGSYDVCNRTSSVDARVERLYGMLSRYA